MSKRINNIYKILGGRIEDPGCNFANGGGYYQLTPEAIRMFDNAFIEAVKEMEPELFKKYEKAGRPFNIKDYAVGRWLNDSGSPLYGSLITRLCIDDKFRRWGQIYYANNTSEGKNVKLGDL